MKNFVRWILPVLALGVSFNANATMSSCPDRLKNMTTAYLPEGETLCSVYRRYHEAGEKLRKQNIDVDHIADVRGPRFIDDSFWRAHASVFHYDPWLTYPPRPATWQGWENGVAYVDSAAAYNAYYNQLPPLALPTIEGWHYAALKNLAAPGESPSIYRPAQEVFFYFDRQHALAKSSVEVLEDGSGYMKHSDPTQKLDVWHSTKCAQDESDDFKTAHAAEIKAAGGLNWRVWDHTGIAADDFFKGDDGNFYQCGFETYSPPEEVKGALGDMLDDLNSKTQTWSSDSPQGDPIRVATRAQRWLVSIHPFYDGNGRTSRYVLDYVLRSLGLPAPVLAEMNDDVFVTEDAWAHEVGEGLVRASKAAEHCADHLKDDPFCGVVSPTAPTNWTL